MATKTNSTTTSSPDARRELCVHLATMLRTGAVRVRVRFNPKENSAIFYTHHDNSWHQHDSVVLSPRLLQSLQNELDLLASNPKRDHFEVHQHAAADWCETELTFHRDALKSHLTGKLESTLDSLLFRDSHDSKQDIRRRMRPSPNPKQR